MPETCTIRYWNNQAPADATRTSGAQKADRRPAILDLGNASREEARWWAAVVAPGRGWEATLVVGLETFWSPWSIRVQSDPCFVIPRNNDTVPESLSTPPSFIEALTYLDKFCVRHNIVDQSHAALAAVLLLPTMGDRMGGLYLPAVVLSDGSPHPQRDDPIPDHRHDWLYQNPNHLDKLLTLGCFVKGVRPMLLGAFYNPNIECNAVSSWLQGTMTVLHALAESKRPLTIGRMLMDRNPAVALLWVGATILGLQGKLLRDAELGNIPPNNLSAEWSGKVQSFIQQPVSRPLVVDGVVSLADQCRILYLSQTKGRIQPPTCPWRPFGSTPLEDVDSKVQLHANCAGHGLRYMGFTWNCAGHRLFVSTVEGVEHRKCPAVDYRGLQLQMESQSGKATQSIFKWLRGRNGLTHGEKEILQHEWFKSERWAFCPAPAVGSTSELGMGMVSGGGSMTKDDGNWGDKESGLSRKAQDDNRHEEGKTAEQEDVQGDEDASPREQPPKGSDV